MDIDQISGLARDFADKLRMIKAEYVDFPWYPHDSFANFEHLKLFSGSGRDIFQYVGPGKKVVDIGAADGDTSFFLESLGADITIIENPSTNANDCRAILELRARLQSKMNVQFIDLEWASWIPGHYDLAVFLGIMYHLRNPGLVLNTLAHSSRRLLLSTMVFFQLEDGTDVHDKQLGYFLDRRELHDDPTNYWLFTPKALRILLRRSGWIVTDEFVVGDAQLATPSTGDCRMFCTCERIENWQDLRVHHDF